MSGGQFAQLVIAQVQVSQVGETLEVAGLQLGDVLVLHVQPGDGCQVRVGNQGAVADVVKLVEDIVLDLLGASAYALLGLGCLGLPGLRRRRSRGRAGQRLFVGSVVGEGHPHLDRLANVVSHKRVGGGGLALNVRVVSQPLVAEHGVGQSVLVGDARGVRRQRLAHLDRTADGGRSRCKAVRPGRHRRRRRAGQRLFVGSVVGEAHPHLDRLANVVSHKRVGGGGLALNVRVVSQPLVAENSVGQPVLVV